MVFEKIDALAMKRKPAKGEESLFKK